MSKLWLPLASLYGLLGVMLGAFGAHALRDQLTPDKLAVWHTAVDYQFWHALALAVVGVRMRHAVSGTRLFNIAGTAFALGVPMFSGSLYLLTFMDIRAIGIVTPIGGLFLMIGWAMLGIGSIRTAKKPYEGPDRRAKTPRV